MSTPAPPIQKFVNRDIQIRDERDGNLVFLSTDAQFYHIVAQARHHILRPEIARKFVVALRGTETPDESITAREGMQFTRSNRNP
jgi:hypothetical protein